MHLWITTLVIAYLLGSIPFGYLLVRFFRNEDVRATGSGNIGATNVARTGSKGLAIATLVLDALKGALAVVIARHSALDLTYPDAYNLVALAGLLAVMGHIFPVWLGFRGGKGVATALGVFLALTPLAALIILGIFIVVVFSTRYVSLASIVAAAAYPFCSVPFDNKRTAIVIAVYIAIPLLVIVKHHGNISRLLNHTENKFGSKKAAAA